MELTQRIDAFAKLGKFLEQFNLTSIKKADNIEHNELFFDGFLHQMKIAEENNSWFTKDSLLFTFENWAKALQKENLEKWLSNEKFSKNSKKVAIIMAGNIPLVGFHDFLSILISGHSTLVKLSSNDKHLLPFLAKYLEYVEPEFKNKIEFTEGKLKDYDLVIATGSNNSSRYFEYYFKDKPSIIRKSRNSIAVLTGNETKEELTALSDDVFHYFGLGCRSVSKIFVPRGYDFNNFFGGMYGKSSFIDNVKYANNYDYNKAVYLMSEFDILENGFLMIKEDPSYSSPIATVFYEYYDSLVSLKEHFNNDKDKIQCIVANGFEKNEIAFGQTQSPKLWDYADDVNTLEFLASE